MQIAPNEIVLNMLIMAVQREPPLSNEFKDTVVVRIFSATHAKSRLHTRPSCGICCR